MRTRALALPSAVALATALAACGASSRTGIPIGDRRASREPATPRLAGPVWTPFLGVACRRPNWAGCDRIGIGVAAGARARRVIVEVAGRRVTLRAPGAGNGDIWLGFLRGEGPAHGALRVRSGRGRIWEGEPAVCARVQLIAVLADGRRATSVATWVQLHAGFG